MYFVYMNENRSMKPVEIILRRWGAEGGGRMMEGINLIKKHCNHIYKCHNEPSCTNNIC
jgi:hypothetical protein